MNPWDIKRENFPKDGSLADMIKFVLGYAILAPSTHNSQPWLFKVKDSSVEVYYDPRLFLPEADPRQRDLYISLGCMLENLVIAASYFGIFSHFKYVLKDDFAAEVYFQAGNPHNTDLEYLVDTIPKRSNARGIFDPKPVPGKIQGEMMSLNKDGRIRLDFITDKEQIKKLASITAEGLKLAHGRPSFRNEMRRWLHNSLTSKKDGMPGYSLRMPFVLSFIIPTLVRLFDLSPLLAKLNYRSMASAPFVCIFSSETSEPVIWLEIGRLAERSMLQLNSQGIRTSIFVASLEMGDLYKKVQEVVGLSLVPQFLFCAGYMSSRQRHSPRHNVENKVL